ncbi:MAG: endonuclease/exonuclease/phosphatase family protein [Acidobacteriota bacterium]|jgi:endonuclease/exonuclease/phosphatase family metal-dependent hydrolase
MKLLLLLLLAIPAAGEDLRVATYNVRYPAPGDGANVWHERKDLFVRSLEQMRLDVFGTQELFAPQAEYITAKLPQYAWFGISRRGNHEDEHMGVFYRMDKLKLIESGNFWLSPTPEVAGSSAWGMTLPRMATWGVFEIKSTGRRLYFVNTHFPHRREDEAARLECAKVLVAFLLKRPRGIPAILTGDFNTDAAGAAYELLTQTLKEAKPAHAGGTFHGFSGKPGTARIDWILYSGLKLKGSEIVRFNEAGRYPSDHFPVVAAFSAP